VPRNDRGGGLASQLFWCHCEPKAWQSRESKTQKSKGKNKSEVKDQNEEGFYILVCHFDFLCLIFDIVWAST